ncbi:MAG TPA: response regulator, partial [Burkholderiaceae bacterium]|nr:response regulator [Burkholderiaceae bacterium]
MKVLIVDDHALIRDALARVLADLVPDVRVLEAADPRLAFEIIERAPELDLVLLDLALPGMHGLSVLQSLRDKHPAIAVVVISATADRDSVQRALDHGALGFIPKSSSNEVLKNALRL